MKAAIANYVAHRKVSNAAGGQETLLHDLVIICKDFRAACQVIEAIVQSGDVLDLLAEFAGIDTVKFRRLMQSDKGIGVVPVSPWAVPSVDDDET